MGEENFSSGMGYISSALINCVGDIGERDPVIFQRDRRLVVASCDVFGVMDVGLPTDFRRWEERGEYRKNDPEPAARKYSRPVGWTVKFPGMDSTLEGDEGDLMYFQPLVSDPNGFGVSIEDMNGLVGRCRKLIDDGNVRLLDHSSRYHSHKGGYACDGTDVVPVNGRVMPKDRFLKLIRREEEEFFNGMRDTVRISKGRNSYSSRIYSNYDNIRNVALPDAFLLTPHIFASFIRRGLPNFEDAGLLTTFGQRWERGSKLDTSPMVRFDLPCENSSSPFGMNVVLNPIFMRERNAEGFSKSRRFFKLFVERELDAIEGATHKIESTIGELNEIHNNLFKE